MSLILRVLLIIMALFTSAYTIRKIRKAQMKIGYAMYWFLMVFLVLILGLFPGIAIWVAKVIGIESPVNLVYLVILFLVIVKLFAVSLKQSQLENEITILTEEIAIRENRKEKKDE